jgi:hypothetical protein
MCIYTLLSALWRSFVLEFPIISCLLFFKVNHEGVFANVQRDSALRKKLVANASLQQAKAEEMLNKIVRRQIKNALGVRKISEEILLNKVVRKQIIVKNVLGVRKFRGNFVFPRKC